MLMSDLLFEIGCEEIPARMLSKALADLPAIVEAHVAGARLGHRGIEIFGTPRRLAIIVRALDEKQSALNEIVVGPPVAIAFAADGTLSKAGQGFATKNAVDPAMVTRGPAEGKKGEYALAKKFVAGIATQQLLPAMLAGWITGIPWQKSMRWGWADERFVRPVQWLVALYGSTLIPVSWRSITASRMSRGHRFLTSAPVEIADAAVYVASLENAKVIVDPKARRAKVQHELARLEQTLGLKIRQDDALLDEVQHLSEWPVGLRGEFAASYLDVPQELIVTAMRTHQRYFAVENSLGGLANQFVTMMGTIVDDTSVVQRGNERVLAARLADAAFFFNEDQKQPLSAFNEKLRGVTFQAKLGDGAKTTFHKVERIVAIVAALTAKLPAKDSRLAARAALAAGLCKADLATGIVGEFPELQGTMGMHYVHRTMATQLGDDCDVVAAAVEDHYRPKGQGGDLPRTTAGALVALADRIDTLVGCFACGLVPSGSADPLGLRRAAIAIIAILLARGGATKHPLAEQLPLTISDLFQAAKSAYTSMDVSKAWTELRPFFEARLRGVLVDEGIDGVTVDVALGVGGDAIDPVDIQARASALRVVPTDVRAAFKRISNILDDAKAKNEPIGAVDASAFVADAERNLWAACTAHNPATALAQGDYAASFAQLAAIGPQISAFFDKGGVMVMDPDPALRKNRLSLLTTIAAPYAAIADFRKLGASS
jgi:glycyl-tRNA synthetase beta chain